MVDDNKPLSVSDIEQKEQKIQTMVENNQNPVTEVSEQGAVQATVENVNNGMMPQGSATPDSNSGIEVVVSNGTSLSGTSLSGALLSGTSLSGTLLSGTALQNSCLKMWDGKPLSEGKLYHRNEMMGLLECSIKENRDGFGRAEEWRKKCREVGMAQPAKYVRARIVKQAGYTPALFNQEKGEWEKVSEDLLDRYYCRMDGHGRAAGHDLELAEAMKNPVYQPFDFIFFFEDIHDPDIFRKQFVSINFDTKKTTNAELAGYAAAVYKNADTQYYNDLLKTGYVAKAAAYYAYAKEPSRDDMKKINEGTSVSVDRPMVDAMKRALTVYRKIFTGKASSKLLNGVPLARWTYNRLKQETDKEKLLKTITQKFSVLTPQYVAVLQEARGVKGDRTRTTEIVLGELFDNILKD